MAIFGRESWLRLSGLPAVVLLAAQLVACTTVDGTNAMTDVGTFEREVATSTLQGLGVIDRERKEASASPRAPLVLPRDPSALPPPGTTRVAALPEDSDTVQIDMTNLSEEDLSRLRNARVVDLRSTAGRPLTADETRQLTARMKSYQVDTGPRPLYLPPDKYYTTVRGQDLVCRTPQGQIVSLSDPACPAEVRAAQGQS